MAAALGELALQQPELADLAAAPGQAGMVGGGDLEARDLDALAIELLEALDQLLLVRTGEGGERRLGLEHLAQQRLVVGLIEGIEGAIRGQAAMMELVGEPGQAERRRLTLLGRIADPELERARLRAPGVEALEDALERQGRDPRLAERLGLIELQAGGERGPAGGHRLQQATGGGRQQDRGLPVADLDHEPQELRQERRIRQVVAPGQDRAQLAPVRLFALPQAAERDPAQGVLSFDPTARGLGGDHAIEQGQLLGQGGRRLGLGDRAQRRPGAPPVTPEPAPPAGAIGGEVLAGGGEVDRPGGLGDHAAELLACRGEALARVDQRLERLARCLPDLGAQRFAIGLGRQLGQAGAGLDQVAELGQRRRARADAQPLLELDRGLEQQRQLLAQRLERAGDRLAVAGQDRRQADAAPGVLGGRAELGDPLGEALDLIAARAQLGAAPMGRARQRDRCRRRAPAEQPGQPADRLERADAGAADRAVQDQGVPVQPLARRRQLLEQVARIVLAGRAELERPLQLLEQALLVGAPAVQLLAELAEADLVEPALDHLERGHLLGHEQHALAGVHRRRDQVGDGLRLAGAGRALDDQVLAGARGLERLGLRGVGVEHVEGVPGGEALVQRRVVGRRVGLGAKAVGQQRAQERPLGERGLGRPGRRVEVPVHQELGEREQAEHDVVGVDPKTGLGGHGLADLPDIGGRIEPLGRVDLGQGQRKILAQLLGQRQVGQDLLVGEPEAEALERARPLEADRDQDQGCMAGLVSGRRLVPFEEAERQVEDADAALLVVGAGVVVEPEQPTLQALGAEPGLQPEVPVLRQRSLGGGRRDGVEQIVARRLVIGTAWLGTGAKTQPLAVLDQEAEQALAALALDLERARAGRVARRVEQPVAPREIEELLARLLQYAVDVAHRIRALLVQVNLGPRGPRSTPGLMS